MSSGPPAAEGIAPGHFPGPPVAAGHVEPCPRRIRARDGTGWVLDTTRAFYVWEHPFYPQYAVPVDDLADGVVDRLPPRASPADDRLRACAVLHFDDASEWYEEDERVHGHPRSPYVRVDAVRSDRTVTVRLPRAGGALVARTSAPVAVFETGLPPRWYVGPTDVDWSALTPSRTVTRCPYKGVTTGYWEIDGLGDVAWSYGSPTPAVQPIAGMISFDDTVVDVAAEPG